MHRFDILGLSDNRHVLHDHPGLLHDPDGHRFEFFFETARDDEEGKRLLGQYNAPSDSFHLDPL